MALAPTASAAATSPAVAKDPVCSRTSRTVASDVNATGRRPTSEARTRRAAPSALRTRRKAGGITPRRRPPVARSLEAQFARVLLHRRDHEREVLVEVHAEIAGRRAQLLAIDRGGEAGLLELLLDRLRGHAVDALGADVRDGGDEPRQLVDGVEGLLHARLAGHAEDGRRARRRRARPRPGSPAVRAPSGRDGGGRSPDRGSARSRGRGAFPSRPRAPRPRRTRAHRRASPPRRPAHGGAGTPTRSTRRRGSRPRRAKGGATWVLP
jgi:hypothetical protein